MFESINHNFPRIFSTVACVKCNLSLKKMFDKISQIASGSSIINPRNILFFVKIRITLCQ